MSFLSLILKGLARQRTRTSLTVLGIAIGITTVVALGVIADGLIRSATEVLRAGGSDFMVGQKGSADLTFSTISMEEWRTIQARPDVEHAVGALIYVKRVGKNPYFVTIGVDPKQVVEVNPTLVSGRLMDPQSMDEVLLGDQGARELGVAVGDSVTIDKATFRIVGIYHTGNIWQDASAYAPLSEIQAMAGREGFLAMVYVTVAPGQDIATVKHRIEEEQPQLVAISEQSEYGEVDTGMTMVNGANLAISLLAVGIGAIGVMNTMIMSVFERTREIGIMRAVGWSGRRILTMVIGESLILCLIATVVGSGLGVLLAKAVTRLPAIKGFLLPAYSPDIFLRSLVIAVIVALAGAAYPAFRAVRLTPMEALRHE